MDYLQAIRERHSVRSFINKAIESEKIEILRQDIDTYNRQSGLRIQLITNDAYAFDTMLAHYGKFTNAVNYFAVVGKKSVTTDSLGGYYGEKLVLKSQMLGLNTCWVALTFSKKKSKIQINNDEKLVCVIALGYGESQGKMHKTKTFEQVTRNVVDAPQWFKNGVEAALLAPTSLNQQKFYFELHGNKVRLKRNWGPYSKIDIGIVKLHFEIGAGTDNFIWE